MDFLGYEPFKSPIFELAKVRELGLTVDKGGGISEKEGLGG
jgi:hypothetical protein